MAAFNAVAYKCNLSGRVAAIQASYPMFSETRAVRVGRLASESESTAPRVAGRMIGA